MPEVEMTKPGAETAPETPTQQIVRAATAERMVEIKNPDPAPEGMLPVVSLHYRPMRVLERMDLNGIAGPQNAVNMAWMADASIAFSVTKINGEAARKPANMGELRALIARIGDAGMDALAADATRDVDTGGANLTAEMERAKN